MKEKSVAYIYFILCLLSTQPLIAQEATTTETLSNRTAYTLPKGGFEFGLFQPLRYGFSNRLELSAHPILIFLDPQLKAKIRLRKISNFQISSEHGFAYPTPLLKTFQMKGAGGLISLQYKIPSMLSIYNGMIVSCIFGTQSIASAKAGFFFSLGSKSLDKTSSIDLPVIYPRMESYYHQPVINLALDLRSGIIKHFCYLLTSEYFIIPGCKENFFFENRGNIQWKPRQKFILQGGYRLCYGRYPFGNQWHLLPDIDFIFRLGPKAITR